MRNAILKCSYVFPTAPSPTTTILQLFIGFISLVQNAGEIAREGLLCAPLFCRLRQFEIVVKTWSWTRQ